MVILRSLPRHAPIAVAMAKHVGDGFRLSSGTLQFVQDHRELAEPSPPAAFDVLTERAFAAHMRDLRQRYGMSQQALVDTLARRFGLKLDPTAITRMERGVRAIRLGEAIAIGQVLDIQLDSIVESGLPIQVWRTEFRLEQIRQAINSLESEEEIAHRDLLALRQHVRKIDQLMALEDEHTLLGSDIAGTTRLMEEAEERGAPQESIEALREQIAVLIEARADVGRRIREFDVRGVE